MVAADRAPLPIRVGGKAAAGLMAAADSYSSGGPAAVKLPRSPPLKVLAEQLRRDAEGGPGAWRLSRAAAGRGPLELAAVWMQGTVVAAGGGEARLRDSSGPFSVRGLERVPRGRPCLSPGNGRIRTRGRPWFCATKGRGLAVPPPDLCAGPHLGTRYPPSCPSPRQAGLMNKHHQQRVSKHYRIQDPRSPHPTHAPLLFGVSGGGTPSFCICDKPFPAGGFPSPHHQMLENTVVGSF